MKYESIAKRVARRYRAVEEDGTYFFNEAGDVVAYENDRKNLLTMYVKGNDAIFSHYGIVAVAIAKDFVLTYEYRTQKADVLVIGGLCGAVNSIKRISNMILCEENSYNVRIGPKARKRFGVKERWYISTMGDITSSNKVNLDIGVELDVSALFNYCDGDVSFQDDNLVYGLLNYRRTGRSKVTKCISEKDYDVFRYLREENAWYWEAGHNTAGSCEKAGKIMKTAYGTNYHVAVKVKGAIFKKFEIFYSIFFCYNNRW